MSVYLCLPAYNEEPSIDPLFSRIVLLNQSLPADQEKVRVVLYDDGSTDRTVSFATRWSGELDLTILGDQSNRGLGVAVRSLLLHFDSNASHEDIAVIMDCDDTHDPMQIPQLVEALQSSDVVIASRYRKGSAISGVPINRLIMSFIFMLIVKAVLPIKGVRDYSCGYRGYKSRVIKEVSKLTDGMFVQETGFAAMPELLWNCARVGAHVSEIPMDLAYERKLSDSKMDVNGNTKRLLMLIVKLRLNGGWRRNAS